VRWATAAVLQDGDPKKSTVAAHTVEDVAEQLLGMLAATDPGCKVESAGDVRVREGQLRVGQQCLFSAGWKPAGA